MRYSDIEKCCNSSRTKVPSLQVQSCFRDCYRVSEVESLIIERLSLWFDFNVGASLTNKCGMQWRNQGRDLWGPAPLIFRRKWGPDGRKHFFWGRAPPYFRVWMTAPPPALSEGLDPPLVSVCFEHHRVSAARTLPFCITGHGILTTNALAW